ncbi:DUF1707 domain-containing protein [Streptomyces sp. TRM 70351]|uniref:DUF1707 SHOCT-like domain-containing protein n=1 Tax=Streptomyces sp. TRM 70351 TaxID=3116552 RepID=UPI002E7AD708|nr:DUF1707 domain-containing protein [Streptomyces sp. TRM 70351]MEE1927772.1 DUF1707 domain-containing protein [Streptomyces sp. TRM 70351]
MDDAAFRKQPAPPAARTAGRPDPVRASDADRDRVADLLGDALAEGRLTAEEHADRVGAAYAARTLGELEPLVADLPGGRRPGPGAAFAADAAAPPASRAGRTLVAVFSGAARRGRWRAGPRIDAFACFGSVELDLSEAVFEQQEVVVNAVSLFGSVEITVPENVTLRDAGSGVMGAFEVEGLAADDPSAPVVVVRGVSVCGAVQAAARRGKRVQDLRSRRH